MGPSCRRTIRSTRRRTLFNNQDKSVLVSTTANPPLKPSSNNDYDSSKADDLEIAEMPNNSACSTPKAKRFRIPEIQTCPPAPKKRRIVTSTCSPRRTNTPIAFFASPDIELFFYFALRGSPLHIKLSNVLFILMPLCSLKASTKRPQHILHLKLEQRT
ncbi:hypothetical protein BUALT_Bualt02G0183700 [Buddleja alternifolia]|uniref:Uncharacterized protein n=1 Tax=Buddleja alternifolia TaxID=168488 RepID=A0AAV6Y2R4_9LAMI|nr:hypothetical protein BUALT_Bualt02G0183700 [Buddleja alternifolia]